MKLTGWVVGAAAIVFAAGCTSAPRPLNDADKAAIADSVSQVLNQWIAGLNEQPTAETWIGGFAPGTDIAYVENGVIAPSRDSLVALVRAELRPLASLNVSMPQKRLIVLDRDVVLVTGPVSVVMKDSAGKETPAPVAWMAVYHRTPDGWKLVAGHESSAPPAPAPVRPKRGAR